MGVADLRLGPPPRGRQPAGGREAGRGSTDEGINFVAYGRTVKQRTGANGYGEVNTSASAVRVDHSSHRTMVDAISLA